MTKEFIAQYKRGQQISIDDWEVIHPTLKVDESTTVKQIIDWFAKNEGETRMEVLLIELEK